jgi:hypothetical protein
VADLRSGRSLLATELSRPGWLDFGAFRWRDLATGQAMRAALGVLTPLAVGVAAGRIAAALQAAGQDGPERPAGLPPLRELQQAIWPDPPDSEAADSAAYGLLAATDNLVDAVNTAAYALGAPDPKASR